MSIFTKFSIILQSARAIHDQRDSFLRLEAFFNEVSWYFLI